MEVSPSSIHSFLPSTPSHASSTSGSDRAAAHPQTDRVELSDVAREGTDGIRWDLVRRVKAEIASDSYLTDSKVDVAVGRLHKELFGGA